MNSLERWLRQVFGVPVVQHDKTNLELARQWREQLEERVRMLEVAVEVATR